MSHRLPSAGLAALLVAGFGLPFAAAKPPDLPVDAKVTLKPFEPSGPYTPDQIAPPSYGSGSEEQAVPSAKPAACPAKGTCDAPDPQAERWLVRCLLMGAHPLLGLLPVDELVDDGEEEDAPPPVPQQAGSLMLGLGLDGDLWFAIQPEADGPCYASPELLFWQGCWHLLQHGLADCPWWQTWVPATDLPSGRYLEHPPQYFPPDAPSPQKQEPARTEKDTDEAGDAPEAMIKLQQARKLLHVADFYRRTGHPGSACFYYTMVRMRYPDTPCAEEARAQMSKMHGETEGKQEDAAPESAPVPPKSSSPPDDTVCPYLMQQFLGAFPHGKPIPGVTADNPESPETMYRQAIYYQQTGHLGAARASYEQICRLYPGTRHADMAAAELKQLQARAKTEKSEAGAEQQEAAPSPPKKEKCPPCKSKDVEERLRSPVNVNLTDVPLRQVLDDLRQMSDLNIVLDTPDLQADGIDLNTPLTIKLDNVSMRTALELVLLQARLTYKVIDDGVVLVSHQPHARTHALETRTYPVGDLLFAEDAVALRKALEQSAVKKNEVGPAAEDALIKLITRCIKCESWAEAGGPGTIDYFPLAAALVINQTPDVHERIGQLLQELRRSQQAAEKAIEDQDRADPGEDKAPPDDGSAVGNPTAAASVARLLRRSHKALAAGRHEEAARLVQKALDLDAQAVAGDPLVYKLGLLHQVRRGKPAAADKDGTSRDAPGARPFLVPSLPPVDPGIVPALQQILVSAAAPKKELVLTVDETNGAKPEPAKAEPRPLPVAPSAAGSVFISGLKKCSCSAAKTKQTGSEACCAVADQVRQFFCAEVDVTAEHCRARCEMHVGDCIVRLRWDGEHCDFCLEKVTGGADRCEPASK
jgi:tetratricopeptide (TPR) repeat protein